MPKVCAIEGCTGAYHAKGYCERHYGQRTMVGYRASHPEYLEKERKRAREYMRRRRATDPVFRAKQTARIYEWRKKLKDEVFNAYGGHRCACCGETESCFLELDHINGDGCKHRRLLSGKNVGGSHMVVYYHLRKNGFPPGYQILCANCNVGKHRNKGICPHKAVHA